VLPECVRADGTKFPWALRSGNLIYIGEIPFRIYVRGRPLLVLCDLLFDALAPMTATQHRALVRLEDLHPLSDRRAAAAGRGVAICNGDTVRFPR